MHMFPPYGVIHNASCLYPELFMANYGTVVRAITLSLNFPVNSLGIRTEHFALLRSADPQGIFDTITYLSPVNDQIIYTDTDADASARPYYYKLLAINYC